MNFNNGGFIDDTPQNPADEPAAMEAEVYVDGKLQVGKKKGKGKNKKKKQQDSNYFSDLCGLVRRNSSAYGIILKIKLKQILNLSPLGYKTNRRN